MQEQQTDAETLLAIAWQEAGLRAPVPASPQTPGECQIRGCPSHSWVQIKTTYGPTSVCFKHFQVIHGIATR